MTCLDLLREAGFPDLEKLFKKFPWLNAIRNKCMEELWYELPETFAVTSELSCEDEVIEYFIGNKPVSDVALDHLNP